MFIIILILIKLSNNELFSKLSSRKHSFFNQIHTQTQNWSLNFWIKIYENFNDPNIEILSITNSSNMIVSFKIYYDGNYQFGIENQKVNQNLIPDLNSFDLQLRQKKINSNWYFLFISYNNLSSSFTIKIQKHTLINEVIHLEPLFGINSIIQFTSDNLGPVILYQNIYLRNDDIFDVEKNFKSIDDMLAIYDFSLFNQIIQNYFNLSKKEYYNNIIFTDYQWGLNTYGISNQFVIVKGKLNFPLIFISNSFTSLYVKVSFDLIINQNINPTVNLTNIFYRRNFINTSNYYMSSQELTCEIQLGVPTFINTYYSKDSLQQLQEIFNEQISINYYCYVKFNNFISFQSNYQVDDENTIITSKYMHQIESLQTKNLTLTTANSLSSQDQHFTQINELEQNIESFKIVLNEIFFYEGVSQFQYQQENGEIIFRFGENLQYILWSPNLKLIRTKPDDFQTLVLNTYLLPRININQIDIPKNFYFQNCPSIKYCKICKNQKCHQCFTNYYLYNNKCFQDNKYLIGIRRDQSYFENTSKSLSTSFNNFTNSIVSIYQQMTNDDLILIDIQLAYDLQVQQYTFILHKVDIFDPLFLFNGSEFTTSSLNYLIFPKTDYIQGYINELIQCPIGMYQSFDRETLQIQCVNCNDQIYDKFCQRNIDGCKNFNAGQCTECLSNFVILNPQDSNFICIPNNFLQNYIFQNDLISSNITINNCSIEENGICLTCQSRYQLIDNQCVFEENCDDLVYQCKICNEGQCEQCAYQHMLQNDNFCKIIKDGCFQHYFPYNQTCYTCDTGYELSFDQQCTQCNFPDLHYNNVCYQCKIKNCDICQIDIIENKPTCQTCSQDSNLVDMQFYGINLKGCIIDQMNGCLLYDKFFECLSCDTNYLLFDGFCYLIILNCINQQYDKCLQCDNGYVLSQDKCFLPIQNCLTQILNYCEQCVQFYQSYQQICIQNSIHCLVENNFICSQCDQGYFISQGKCISDQYFQEECLIFNTQNYNCLECIEQFQLNIFTGICFEKIPYCYSYHDSYNICEECIDYYDLSNENLCVHSIIQNQLQNLNLQDPDFLMLFDRNFCLLIVENCILCYDFDFFKCSACDNNYQLIMNQCVKQQVVTQKCSSFCKVCLQQVCLECFENFILENNICIYKYSIQFLNNQNKCNEKTICFKNFEPQNKECKFCKNHCHCEKQYFKESVILNCPSIQYVKELQETDFYQIKFQDQKIRLLFMTQYPQEFSFFIKNKNIFNSIGCVPNQKEKIQLQNNFNIQSQLQGQTIQEIIQIGSIIILPLTSINFFGYLIQYQMMNEIYYQLWTKKYYTENFQNKIYKQMKRKTDYSIIKSKKIYEVKYQFQQALLYEVLAVQMKDMYLILILLFKLVWIISNKILKKYDVLQRMSIESRELYMEYFKEDLKNQLQEFLKSVIYYSFLIDASLLLICLNLQHSLKKMYKLIIIAKLFITNTLIMYYFLRLIKNCKKLLREQKVDDFDLVEILNQIKLISLFIWTYFIFTVQNKLLNFIFLILINIFWITICICFLKLRKYKGQKGPLKFYFILLIWNYSTLTLYFIVSFLAIFEWKISYIFIVLYFSQLLTEAIEKLFLKYHVRIFKKENLDQVKKRFTLQLLEIKQQEELTKEIQKESYYQINLYQILFSQSN